MAKYTKRHRAREWVLRALYAQAMDPDPATDALDILLEHDPPREIDRAFARRLFDTARAAGERFDPQISQRLENWDLGRLALIDLLLLRLALVEFESFPDIPEEVTLNEVIELAKRYSGAQSGAFVNGVLEALRRDRQTQPGDSANTTDESASS